MTVNELIQQLQTYPGDMRVLVPGYEGGYNDIDLKTDSIVFDYNSKDTWYYGSHENAKTVHYMTEHLNTLSGYEYNKFVKSKECLVVTRGK